MNPYYQYQVIKASLTKRAQCPHCLHSFEIMRRDKERELSCLKCGRKFKVSGKNPGLVRQIRKNK